MPVSVDVGVLPLLLHVIVPPLFLSVQPLALVGSALMFSVEPLPISTYAFAAQSAAKSAAADWIIQVELFAKTTAPPLVMTPPMS